MDKKTKSMQVLEEKMQGIDENSLRYQALKAAMNFKNSWISLGRYLYAVSKDKAYKEWGYLTFEAYCAKEIGIKKQTAIKLLRSYYFVENEEPQILRAENREDIDRETVSKLPSYETVNILRLAKVNKKLDEKSYESLREDALEKGKDPQVIKKELRTLVDDTKDPQEESRKRRVTAIRRMVSTLKSLKQELDLSGALTKAIDREIESLISHIESNVPSPPP